MLLGVAGDTAGVGVRDVGDRVGFAGVLGQAGVVEVEPAGVGVHRNVFEDGAELASGLVDIGLGLGADADEPWRSSRPRS